MKTVLLATSALVAFAGAAAAEVAVTGDARIGLRYDDSLPYVTLGGVPAERSGWNVVSRARVKFNMAGETDSGLAFGAELRADNAAGANRGSNASQTAGNVFVSGAYGKLSAGDVDTALEAAVGDLPEIGVSGLNYYNEFNYTSEFNVGAYQQSTLRYEYTFGDASVYASFSDRYAGNSGEKISGNNWSLGAGYTLGNYTFGIGYEEASLFLDPVGYTWLNQSYDYDPAGGVYDALYTNDNRTWGISGGTSWAGVTFKAVYLTTKVEGSGADGSFTGTDWKVRQYGIGAEYEMANGVQLAGFWRRIDGDAVVGFDHDADVYGIGAGYDLGGGAVVKGGIAKIDGTSPIYGGDFDRVVADFGLRLNF